MQSDFKLKGLNKGGDGSFENMYATCDLLEKEDWFHAPVQGSGEMKESMWKYVDNDWGNAKIAEVQHDGFYADGLPVNPMLIGIRHEN